MTSYLLFAKFSSNFLCIYLLAASNLNFCLFEQLFPSASLAVSSTITIHTLFPLQQKTQHINMSSSSKPSLFMPKKKAPKIHHILKPTASTTTTAVNKAGSGPNPSSSIKKKQYTLPPKTMLKNMLARRDQPENPPAAKYGKKMISDDIAVEAELFRKVINKPSAAPAPACVAAPKAAPKQAIYKQRPVAVATSTPAPTRKRIYMPCAEDPSEAVYRARAIDICARWEWPALSNLDKEPTARVMLEARYLDDAVGLVATKAKIGRDIAKLEKQRVEAVKNHEAWNEVSLILVFDLLMCANVCAE